MVLSLTDAARLLGKTPRQVRYAIQHGHLEAKKVGGRWVIDSTALPLSEGQLRARARKAAALHDLVDTAMGPHLGDAKRFGVREIAAFSAGEPLYRTAADAHGEDHPAVAALREALVAVSRGCHRYHDRDKLQAYTEAREQAARAVALGLLDGAAPLAEEIEREVIPAITGLIRRCERKRRR